MKKFLKVLTVISFIGILWSPISHAALIDLEPPASTYQGQSYTGQWSGGVGFDRGFFFNEVSPFTLNTIGIELNLSGRQTLLASLYSVSGTDTVGSLLASNSISFEDIGRAWFDIPLSYSFDGSGDRFFAIIDFGGVQPGEARFWDFEGRGDGGQPIDSPYIVGPVSVFDGTYGLGGSNYVLAHFRMDVDQGQGPVIPEPATMLLLGSGLIGLAGYARRKFKK